MRIQELTSFKDIAEALNIKIGFLRRILFEEKTKLYKQFEIPKKNGDIRVIYTPNDTLLALQRRLLILFENSVQVHPKAYGFVKGKSTVDNANQHLNKNYLLNIDLEDFFPSISSGRVYSMFLRYFRLEQSVASTLTNLCCHPEGFLPQGAPTSPFISNVLCKTLDKELDRLAKNSFGSSYTRYADDITFSSNRPFKEAIVSENNGNIVLGSTLDDIISRNGFKVNANKIRLQKTNQHQEVTGIVVNTKLNIDRRYIRRVKAMLHSIEVNIDDLAIPAQKLSDSKYEGDTIERLFMIIKGMIDYIGMVRGKDDIIFEKLATRFNLVLEFSQIIIVRPIYIPFMFENNVCVIKQTEFYYKDKEGQEDFTDYGQGSGFLLKNYGIVSNYHVFEYLIELIYLEELSPSNNEFYIETFFGEKASQLVKVKIDKFDKEKDIVLLKPEDDSLLNRGFEIRTEPLVQNSEIKLLGYPDFNNGDDLKQEHGAYLRAVTDNGIRKYEVNTIIFAGNSGGPVIDSNNKVIGIATEGKRISSNKVIPISYLDSI